MSLSFHKIVVVGGGVLGTQIGLMCAYTGHDVTFWLRSEGSIGRTQPKIEQYSSMMLANLESAKQLIGNPMGSFLYPRGLIRSWDDITAEAIEDKDALAVIKAAWDKFKDWTAYQLSMLTHRRNSPWTIVYTRQRYDVIPLALIKEKGFGDPD